MSVLEPGPLTFSRSREKHVFLFEKLIVLSKKVESTEGGTRKARKTEVYLYKEHLDVSSIFSALLLALVCNSHVKSLFIADSGDSERKYRCKSTCVLTSPSQTTERVQV